MREQKDRSITPRAKPVVVRAIPNTDNPDYFRLLEMGMYDKFHGMKSWTDLVADAMSKIDSKEFISNPVTEKIDYKKSSRKPKTPQP